MNLLERIGLVKANLPAAARQPDHQMVRCPLCLGKRGCRACKGAGEVEPEHAERISAGMRLRWQRNRRGLSVLQEANRIGIPMQHLINRELGLDEETPL